nr:ectonucleoside triphosphate diphosphohydrolase 1 isoform X4 [Pelodiscus sinensis]|eukprot:XP_025038771.1 ectonucleoside triphosphate diphosphohydrolase 1 isoform X4 [Pelodiscus sinensis]
MSICGMKSQGLYSCDCNWWIQQVTGTKPRTCCPRKSLLILGFLFASAAIALVAMAVTQNKPLPKNIKYGIVLDAGSSHTNLYVYEWPAEKENDTGVVHQVEVCTVQGSGISGYSKDPDEAGLSLQNCIKRAQEMVPEQQHRDTPVYLGATAGMRLLSLQNRSVADRVLSAVENMLRSSPFDFQGARVISGQEEGAYGWITINYLLGNFKQTGWLDFLPHLQSSSGTSGALDLGGASTQITFVPDHEPIESQENSLHFRLYGKSYNVYTHSFLCYGKDQALRLKLAGDLQAFSAFYFVMNFLNLTTEKSPVPLNRVTSTVQRFCSRPWNEVKAEFPNIKEKYLSEYCFSGAYILSLLENGYGFTAEKWQNIQFLGKIGSSDAGWTLGYMLNLTNMIPAEKPPTRPLSHASYVGLMVFCSLVLVAVLLLGCFIFHKPKCLQKGLI